RRRAPHRGVGRDPARGPRARRGRVLRRAAAGHRRCQHQPALHADRRAAGPPAHCDPPRPGHLPAQLRAPRIPPRHAARPAARAPRQPRRRREPMPVVQASREHLATLEPELAYTRETLQATIEELETSNEEMQATNEELIASNEELQSTNEELHSVNEELYTVNAEYQQKIVELKELNTDLAHLLEGTDVGTVFLDRELRIRRFTSQIARVFRFQLYDIGRRISDFSHNIERPQLMEEIEQVRATGAVVEDEVRDRGSVPYFLRVLPYRIGRQSDQ